MSTPIDPLAGHALANPDKPAVIVDGAGGAVASTTTFAELNVSVNRLANALHALGARVGDRIVWCGPNSLEVLTIMHAARKARLIAVPLSYRFVASEMQFIIDNSDAVIVLVDAECAPVVAQIDRAAIAKVRHVIVYGGDPPTGIGFVRWDDVVAAAGVAEPATLTGETSGGTMIYTSGTTGKPKGALRTRALDPDVALALIMTIGLGHPDDVHLTTGPLYHSGPNAWATIAHTLGQPVVVMRKFDPVRWLELVRQYRVTNSFSAPTQMKRVMTLPDDVLAAADLSSMRSLVLNAAPIPYALKQQIIGRFGDSLLYEVYGSTEIGVTTVLKPQDQLRKPGSCGQTYGPVRVKVLRDDATPAAPNEPGELFVGTPIVIDRYHNTDRQLARVEADGVDWFSVGDVAYLDEEGYVYICDRKNDMIISGGVNIYPAEIEAVLHEHPAVLDCGVFGVPDEEWGESVHAVVQPRPGVAIDVDELGAFVAARVAGYKRPRSYAVRDELPRTESGKLLKRQLRDEWNASQP